MSRFDEHIAYRYKNSLLNPRINTRKYKHPYEVKDLNLDEELELGEVGSTSTTTNLTSRPCSVRIL